MKRTWLKASVVAVMSVASWLAMTPQAAQAGPLGIAVGVWGWRNLVAPRVGGPFVAPDIRFQPFAGYVVADGSYWAYPTPANQAQVVVRVPDPNAQVWIQGQPAPEKSRQHIFFSPALEPGAQYNYEIRARWHENEQTNDQTRIVPVRPGQQVIVDFARPATQ